MVIVGENIASVIVEYMIKGKVLGVFNTTEYPQFQRRVTQTISIGTLIYLCIFIYKIVVRTISMKNKLILSKSISKEQVSNRKIMKDFWFYKIDNFLNKNICYK